MQKLAETHETELRALDVALSGATACWSCQAVPFQASASAFGSFAVTTIWKSPPASQELAEAQEIAFRFVNVAPAGFGVDCELQDEPRNAAATPTTRPLLLYWPTASQDRPDAHDTPPRLPVPAGPGIVCALQSEPFQAYAGPEPTASQNFAEAQDTEFTVASEGTGCSCHELPFHCSATVGPGLPALPLPQASQNVGDAHDTVLSCSKKAPAGLGVGCRLHDVPFQAAASVTLAPVELSK